MFNWFKKKSASEKDFPEIIDKLVARLVDAQGGAISSIIKGVNEIDSEIFKDVPNTLYKSQEFIDALTGYQVTCINGFIITEKLIEDNIKDSIKFSEEFWIKIAPSPEYRKRSKLFNKKYLDCWGDIKCLKESFSKDILKLFKIPINNKNIHKLVGLADDSAITFAYQSQVDAAMAFGDKKLGIKLVKHFKKFLHEESYHKQS